MNPDPLRGLILPMPSPVPDWPEIPIDASLSSASRALVKSRGEGLIVVDEGQPVGIIDLYDLIATIADDRDPVTTLPRSGALREWMTGKLIDGNEVAVIFLDLDAFGEVNRVRGHTEGDAELRRAGQLVVEHFGPDCFSARFGGDEFAVVTTEKRERAEEAATKAAAALCSAGIPATWGISGGRRISARPEAHVGAIVEELLRLASLDCMSKKASRAAAAPP